MSDLPREITFAIKSEDLVAHLRKQAAELKGYQWSAEHRERGKEMEKLAGWVTPGFVFHLTIQQLYDYGLVSIKNLRLYP